MGHRGLEPTQRIPTTRSLPGRELVHRLTPCSSLSYHWWTRWGWAPGPTHWDPDLLDMAACAHPLGSWIC